MVGLDIYAYGNVTSRFRGVYFFFVRSFSPLSAFSCSMDRSHSLITSMRAPLIFVECRIVDVLPSLE